MNQWLEDLTQRASYFAQTTETRVDAIPVIGILARAWRAYGRDQCPMLAAALSYYALLAIFPLLLFIFAVVSPYLESDAAMRAMTGFVASYLPSGAQMIRNTLQEVLRARGAITIVAAIGLLWSATGVFDLMQLGINRAFGIAQARALWHQRLISIGMAIAVGFLFLISLLITTSIRVGIHYRALPRGNFSIDVFPVLGAIVIACLVFGFLYRYIPRGVAVRWRDVRLGALVAAILWEIAKLGFSWYLTNYALLNLVYGSIGAVIALMLWGYITAAILLYGAEIVARMVER